MPRIASSNHSDSVLVEEISVDEHTNTNNSIRIREHPRYLVILRRIIQRKRKRADEDREVQPRYPRPLISEPDLPLDSNRSSDLLGDPNFPPPPPSSSDRVVISDGGSETVFGVGLCVWDCVCAGVAGWTR